MCHFKKPRAVARDLQCFYIAVSPYASLFYQTLSSTINVDDGPQGKCFPRLLIRLYRSSNNVHDTRPSRLENHLPHFVRSLDVDRLWYLIGQQGGVPEVLGLLLVFTSLAPACHDLSIATHTRQTEHRGKWVNEGSIEKRGNTLLRTFERTNRGERGET